MRRMAALLFLAWSVASLGVNNGDIPVNTPDSARRMINDLIRTHGERYRGSSEFLLELDAIEEGLKQKRGDGDAEKKLAILVRKASLANPILDFDKVLVIRRKGEANRGLNSHTTADINPKGKDNEISELSNLRGEVKVRTVYRHPEQGVVKHMDVHWSGERIMFSGGGANGKWAVLDVDTDGKDLRELTPSDQPDVQWFDGCYLPEEGHIVACSTAGMQGLPCENGGRPMVNLYRVNVKSKRVRQLTFEQDSDWHPRILPNGRVMYLRWEYTDTPHYFSRYLFHMNPDGTSQLGLWGSGSYFPTAYVWARPIGGDDSKILGIVSGHHAKSETGRLMMVNPSLARKYPFRHKPEKRIWGPPKSSINIVPEVLPAEVTGCVQEMPGWGRDVVGNVYDGQGGGQKYTFGTPWPLSDKYFLVSMRGFAGRKWNLCLVDVFDNMTLVYEDPEYDIFEPMPLLPRERPPVLADRTREGAPATIFCTDIYYGPGLKGIPRGKVKKLRVYAYHYGYIRSGGHESCGLESSWDIKRVLGTVPVENDGSFSFEAPPNTPLAIQPLDEEGAALALMRSWMVGMPGSTLSCVGCHEAKNEATPVRVAQAAKRAPSKIKPWYGPARPFSYATEIQPLLDRNCVGCHNEKNKAVKGRISFEKGDSKNWRNDRSYLNLVAFARRPGPESDLDLYNPMEWHASTSPLIQMLKKGHHGVRVDREMWERLYAWIDLNAPHRGMWGNTRYEERRLELAKRYAGLMENPEEEYRRTLTALLERGRVRPILPARQAKPAPDGLRSRGFPMDAEAAKKAQGSQLEMQLELAAGVAMRVVRIPGGEFVMGSQERYADEAPRAVARIGKAYGMGVHEVTCRQYAAFDPQHDNRYLDEHGKDHSVPGYIANHPDQPVARISWQQANAFCAWLSTKSGKKVRLPTEAEWEWAARAGSSKQFFYGDDNEDFSMWANLADASRRTTYVSWDGGSKIHVRRDYPADYLFPLRDDRYADKWFIVDFVRQYEPNAWGLYDMVGNVCEWTYSDYKAYPYVRADGRNGGRLDVKKVARGGSWNDRPKTAGSSVRFAYESYQKVYNVGFRVVVEDVSEKDFTLKPVPPVVAPPIANTQPGPGPARPRVTLGTVTALAGGGDHSRERPEEAFDGESRTKWFHPGVATTWVQCQFRKGARKAFSAYEIASANDCRRRDPMDWRVLGSNDGKKWTTLDTRKGEKFANRHETRKFSIADKKAFNIYRLWIDKPLEPGDGIQLSEFTLTGESK